MCETILICFMGQLSSTKPLPCVHSAHMRYSVNSTHDLDHVCLSSLHVSLKLLHLQLKGRDNVAEDQHRSNPNSMEENENRELRDKVTKLSKEVAELSKERNVLMNVVHRTTEPEPSYSMHGTPAAEERLPGAIPALHLRSTTPGT